MPIEEIVVTGRPPSGGASIFLEPSGSSAPFDPSGLGAAAIAAVAEAHGQMDRIAAAIRRIQAEGVLPLEGSLLPEDPFKEAREAIELGDVQLEEAAVFRDLRRETELAEAKSMGLFDNLFGGLKRLGTTVLGIPGAAADVAAEILANTASDVVPEAAEAVQAAVTARARELLGLEKAPTTVVAQARTPGVTPRGQRIIENVPVSTEVAMANDIEVLEAGIIPPALLTAGAGALVSGGGRALAQIRRFLPEIGAGAVGAGAGTLLDSLFGRGAEGGEGSISRGIMVSSGNAGMYHTTPVRVRFDPRTGEAREVGGNRAANSLTLVEDPETGRMEFFVHAGRPTHFSKIGKYPRARTNSHAHHRRARPHKARVHHRRGHRHSLTQKQLAAGFGGKAHMRAH